MKVILVVLAMMFSFSGLATAEPFIDWFEDIEDQQRLAVDAPYLIKLGDAWALGGEVSKDIHNNNSNEGWIGSLKFTYLGNLKSFFQKG